MLLFHQQEHQVIAAHSARHHMQYCFWEEKMLTWNILSIERMCQIFCRMFLRNRLYSKSTCSNIDFVFFTTHIDLCSQAYQSLRTYETNPLDEFLNSFLLVKQTLLYQQASKLLYRIHPRIWSTISIVGKQITDAPRDSTCPESPSLHFLNALWVLFFRKVSRWYNSECVSDFL